MFALHVAGHTGVIARSRGFGEIDKIDDSFAEVLSGAVPARLVIGF